MISNGKRGAINSLISFEMIILGIGIIKTISISNTKNNTASRKNRRERGIREFLSGSNPHSNGECFSRSAEWREFRIEAAITIILAIKRHNKNEDSNLIIKA